MRMPILLCCKRIAPLLSVRRRNFLSIGGFACALCCSTRVSPRNWMKLLNCSAGDRLVKHEKIAGRSWVVVYWNWLCWKVRVLLRIVRLTLTFGPLLAVYPAFCWSRSGLEVWFWLLYQAVRMSGPTFIKLGQWASTRRDVFSPEFCDIFAELQRKCRRQNWRETEKVLNRTFGQNWGRFFVDFEKLPVGSGSVAQVHKAKVNEQFWRLLSQENAELRRTTDLVAVKIVHFPVLECITMDLALLENGARLLHTIAPPLRYLNLAGAAAQFRAVLMNQVDMRREARWLKEFSKNFSNSSQVRFPTHLYNSEMVLIETFETGEYLNPILSGASDPPSIVVSESAKRNIALATAHAMLKMIFVDNLVHGDLHPGNILVDFGQNKNNGKQPRDRTWKAILAAIFGDVKKFFCPIVKSSTDMKSEEKPSLIFLDPGIAIRQSANHLRNFMALFLAAIQGDGERVGELLLQHAPYQRCRNTRQFKKDIAELVKKTRHSKLALRHISISKVLMELFMLAGRHNVGLDPSFTCVVLAVVVVEGLSRSLDPDLDILNCAAPFIAAGAAKFTEGYCNSM